MSKTAPNALPASAVAALLVTGALLLTACQSPPARTESPATSAQQEADYATFAAQFRSIVALHMLAANRRGAVGEKNLRVELNRDNEIVSCRAETVSPSVAHAMPVVTNHRGGVELARLINQECRKIIFPLVPKHLFDDKGIADVIAPLKFLPLPPAAAEQRRSLLMLQAQRDFFWHQVLVDQPVDSVGRASFSVQADAVGQVSGCVVNLAPVTVRQDAFKPDNALQTRLISRCLALDLRQMPGFALDDKGQANARITVQYAPWKTGLR